MQNIIYFNITPTKSHIKYKNAPKYNNVKSLEILRKSKTRKKNCYDPIELDILK